MIRATVDTNVLASGIARRNPASAVVQIVDRWRAGHFDLIISDHIVTELAHTLAEPYFRRHITVDTAAQFIELLCDRAILTPILVSVHGVATHPEDDLILATAVSANASFLVTGDTHLQSIGAFEGVMIVGPRAFLDHLGA